MIHLLELSVTVFSQKRRPPTVNQCIVLRLAGSLVEDKNWFCQLWCVSKESEASVAIFIGTFWFVFRPGQVLRKQPASTELKKEKKKKIDTSSHYYEKRSHDYEKLEKCHILATVLGQYQTSLDAFQVHEFIPMKHLVLVRLHAQSSHTNINTIHFNKHQ